MTEKKSSEYNSMKPKGMPTGGGDEGTAGRRK